MSFANPEFLFALAAISVPIIIHLFNFRRFKKIYFSDIRFLKDVEIETKSRNQLKNLLILLTRILAIIFLVMAFARPVIPTGTQAESATDAVVVYIDNSFSMNANGESGNLLEEAKEKAIEIGSAYASGSQLRLLTNDFAPEHFRDLSFEEFKNEVASVQSSPVVRSIDDIVSRTSGMFGQINGVGLYYISDLQRNTSLPYKSISDSLLGLYVVPVESEIESNIYIDSCWFESPSRLQQQPDELIARVRNTGSNTIENLSVKLSLNGIQRSVATTKLSAQSYEDVRLAFTNPEKGQQLVEISIQDYPITYDDSYYLSYNLANSISILCVEEESSPKYVAKLFGSESNFALTQVPSKGLDYSILRSTNLLVLNEVQNFSSGMIQEVMKFVNEGGTLLLIPSESPDLNSTNELLLACGAEQFAASDSGKTKVEGVNLQSALFKNVFTQWEDRIDLPAVNKHYPTVLKSSSNAERLLTLSNGEPLLTSYSAGEGKCFVLSAPLRDSWTNFHRHALFVPTLYNIALNSTNSGTSAETIGVNNFISVKSKLSDTEILEMQKTDEDRSFVPERVSRAQGNGIYVHDQVENDGHYVLSTESGDTIQVVSFNYDRSESDLEFLSSEELIIAANAVGISNAQLLQGSTASLANQIQELHNGKQLWRLFLILALACLLIETLLIRIL